MNLKEAFRFQNKLQALIEEAQRHLANDQNVLKVKTTYLRSKAMEGAEDEVIEENLTSQFAGRANELMAFLMDLLEQKGKNEAAHGYGQRNHFECSTAADRRDLRLSGQSSFLRKEYSRWRYRLPFQCGGKPGHLSLRCTESHHH